MKNNTETNCPTCGASPCYLICPEQDPFHGNHQAEHDDFVAGCYDDRDPSDSYFGDEHGPCDFAMYRENAMLMAADATADSAERLEMYEAEMARVAGDSKACGTCEMCRPPSPPWEVAVGGRGGGGRS